MRWAVRLSWVANTSFCSPRRHRRTACSRTNDFCARCTAGHTSGNSTGWGSSPRSSICVETRVKRTTAHARCKSADLRCLLERDQVALHQGGKSQEHAAGDKEVAVKLAGHARRARARHTPPHGAHEQRPWPKYLGNARQLHFVRLRGKRQDLSAAAQGTAAACVPSTTWGWRQRSTRRRQWCARRARLPLCTQLPQRERHGC